MPRPKTLRTAADIRAAYAAYRRTLADLRSIEPCPAHWPEDPPGPDYPGTPCQLLEGHTLRDGTKHRHRILGSQTVVQW